MVVLSVVIFRHLALLPVVCTLARTSCRVNSNIVDTGSRFAFVEYESRRDADDAYHEMHNKRIGRDDLLKIEVGKPFSCRIPTLTSLVGQNSSIGLLALRFRS